MKFYAAIDAQTLTTQCVYTCKVQGVSVGVVKTMDDQIFAFENYCTHADVSLKKAPWDSCTGYLTCPAHQAVFDICNQGNVVVGPAVLPLEMLPCEIRMEGEVKMIYVGLKDDD